MKEPKWLTRLIMDAIHLDQTRKHGGRMGVRDNHLIESSLARPIQRWNYEPDSDIATLAAAYGSGLVQNHGYLDCNRRIAFMVMYVFLAINGWELLAPEAEVVTVMLDLAMGNLTESDLAQWLSERMSAIGCS
ncbi:MAG: type II toxin-antitoxin system death-on-curing family toxin [Firmicutes bacterium]|nr:type II toxin-antitoxin system death-on-curing family toxin [Bacillota bacterium]